LEEGEMVCSPKTGPFIMRKFCRDEKSGKEDFLDETVPVYRPEDTLSLY
jgi:hypothetical protein